MAQKKQTREQIQKKWESKLEQIKKNKERETLRRIQEREQKLHERTQLEIERKKLQIQRKANAYINRKKSEYDRKCKNEIRKLQGKPEKQYKLKTLTRNQKLQFALAISQENARLRDSDADGYAYCISCQMKVPWKQHAGGHGRSRTIQGVCLRESNINAQCHPCNYAMGPEGNIAKKKRIEMQYWANARKKRGDIEIDDLENTMKKSVRNPGKYAPSTIYLDDIIPELIRKNEELRKEKNFHEPGKNRRKIYEKYRNLSIN